MFENHKLLGSCELIHGQCFTVYLKKYSLSANFISANNVWYCPLISLSRKINLTHSLCFLFGFTLFLRRNKASSRARWHLRRSRLLRAAMMKIRRAEAISIVASKKGRRYSYLTLIWRLQSPQHTGNTSTASTTSSQQFTICAK